MSNPTIENLQRIFTERLEALEHILDVGSQHLPDINAALKEGLAPDMFPLGTQVAFVCNQPRGFSQWCAGQPIDNLGTDVETIEAARGHIRDTKALVAGIQASDAKLDEIKCIGLGPGRYCELPGHRYVNDYLMPNLYFHITTAYDILRHLGVPLGKQDYMSYLAPHVRMES